LPHVVMLLSNPFVSDPRVYSEVKALSQNGYDVAVITWDREYQYPSTEDRQGILVRRIHAAATFGRGLRQMGALLSFWQRAISMLIPENVDIVHCHDLDTLPVGWFTPVSVAPTSKSSEMWQAGATWV